MTNDYVNELKKLLEKLPGIGPRQASRFIWAMVDFTPDERAKISELIRSLDDHLSRCYICLRIFSKCSPSTVRLCSYCKPNSQRDNLTLMVVERDNDLLNIEKSGAYNGLYHVLGGLVDPLEANQRAREGIKKLYERISRSSTSDVRSKKTSDVFPREIILAISPTKLGEFTGNYIIKILEPLTTMHNIKISRLARGLSTGTELEYADEFTLRQALDNRK